MQVYYFHFYFFAILLQIHMWQKFGYSLVTQQISFEYLRCWFANTCFSVSPHPLTLLCYVNEFWVLFFAFAIVLLHHGVSTNYLWIYVFHGYLCYLTPANNKEPLYTVILRETIVKHKSIRILNEWNRKHEMFPAMNVNSLRTRGVPMYQYQ